jgi:DNA replication protein DnaC
MDNWRNLVKKSNINVPETKKESIGDIRAYEAQRERWYNETKEYPVNGYDCPICKNKGDTLRIVVNDQGGVYEESIECECERYRSTSYRMAISGLNTFDERLSFSMFERKENFQNKMFDEAVAYVKQLETMNCWFFIGGQSGCGKTHLAVAMTRQLVSNGHLAKYMNWRSESVAIKHEREMSKIREYQNAQILLIDDFLKVAENEVPTPADIRLAFEILDYRYARNMPTIITSEMFLEIITNIDESIGSRIKERAKRFVLSVKKEDGRNYR